MEMFPWSCQKRKILGWSGDVPKFFFTCPKGNDRETLENGQVETDVIITE